jgi:hypothetical protein
VRRRFIRVGIESFGVAQKVTYRREETADQLSICEAVVSS